MSEHEHRIRVASAPVSFGVDEVVSDDAWMPEAQDVLRWMAELGYAGTEMGPPGYLGSGPRLREQLRSLELEMVGAFLPLHFSRDERIEADISTLESSLDDLAGSAAAGSAPLAVLCEAIDEPTRLAHTGRIASHPEARLGSERWDALIRNLHRAGQVCRDRGIEPVIHPHGATYLETAAEIERLMEGLDTSIVGLCMDSGHFKYGGADPVRAVRDYASAIRHVHLKDTDVGIRDEVVGQSGDFADAVRAGVFPTLGSADSGIAAVVEALFEIEYRGWVVVEQDQYLDRDDTPETLVEGQRRNREFLRRLGL